MKKFLTLIIVATTIASCASTKYTYDNYKNIEPVKIEMPDDTYRVFDNYSEKKMLVTSSVEAALLNGLGNGLTLGAADTTAPKPLYNAAAERFLNKHHIKCQIKDGYLISTPNYEFIYDCKK